MNKLTLSFLSLILLVSINYCNTDKISCSSSSIRYIDYILESAIHQDSKFSKIILESTGSSIAISNFCSNKYNAIAISRPLKYSEINICKKNNVQYTVLEIGQENIIPVVSKNSILQFMPLHERLLYNAIFMDKKISNKLTWGDIGQTSNEYKYIPLMLYIPSKKHGTRSIIDEGLSRNICHHKTDQKCVSIRKDGSVIEMDSGESDIVNSILSHRNSIGIIGCSYYRLNMTSLSPILHDQRGQNIVDNICKNVGWKMNRDYYLIINNDYYKKSPIMKDFLSLIYGDSFMNNDLVYLDGYEMPNQQSLEKSMNIINKIK